MVLVLAIRLGEQNYAIPTRHVVEVTPLVSLRTIPQAPPHVAGVCNYRGQIVPVIDLSKYLIDFPCEPRLSTRIVFLQAPHTDTGIVGLMAEGVTETLDLSWGAAGDEAGASPGDPSLSYLGPVLQHESGLIQVLDMPRLLGSPTAVPVLPELGVVREEGD